MKHKMSTFILGFVVVTQIWIPAAMIFSSEKTLEEGAAFKFKTAPVDPYDAFRGKYVALRFESAGFEPPAGELYNRGESIYVSIQEDSEGFAAISAVSRLRPADPYFVKAQVKYNYGDSLTIAYPFEKYFLEEFSASRAEEIYRQANRGEKQEAYVLVRVSTKGDAVIENLIIGGIPLQVLLTEEQ